jgi:deazaflavin-dependent oxidoreductase (nitroreductase family)
MKILVWLCWLAAVPLIMVMVVRFLKRPAAAFHRAFTNRIAARFVSRLPGFGIVVHLGRRSGKVYRTPVNVFWRRDAVLIALTYGRESGWVRNVLARKGCELETRRGAYRLFSPVLVHDPSRRPFPLLVRTVLGWIAADDYLQLAISDRVSDTMENDGMDSRI